jgi:hypothetical protein
MPRWFVHENIRTSECQFRTLEPELKTHNLPRQVEKVAVSFEHGLFDKLQTAGNATR